MADHDEVNAHGLDVLGGVDERFALAQAGVGGAEVENVGAEPPRRQSEAGARARRRFEEEIDDNLVSQVGPFSPPCWTRLYEGLRRVEDGYDFLRGQFLQAQ